MTIDSSAIMGWLIKSFCVDFAAFEPLFAYSSYCMGTLFEVYFLPLLLNFVLFGGKFYKQLQTLNILKGNETLCTLTIYSKP